MVRILKVVDGVPHAAGWHMIVTINSALLNGLMFFDASNPDRGNRSTQAKAEVLKRINTVMRGSQLGKEFEKGYEMWDGAKHREFVFMYVIISFTCVSVVYPDVMVNNIPYCRMLAVQLSTRGVPCVHVTQLAVDDVVHW